MATKREETRKGEVTLPGKMAEVGYSGLNIFKGVSHEELKRELNFPQSIKTFREMSYHAAINAPLTLYQNLISKVHWRFVPPKDATDEEKDQCLKIEEMMHDMEQPWEEFISDVLSAQTFGFSVHEKVYRKRLKKNGSKYDDGVIGWKKLPIRVQDTIKKFLFDKSGNEVTGVVQDLNRLANSGERFNARGVTQIEIPAAKLIHFKFGKHRGDPFGKSPLRDAYIAWTYLVAVEEIEAHGVAKDLSGIPILMLPPQYLSDDATPAQKSIRAYYEQSMRNLQINQQSSMILPQAYDPDTRQPLFELKLLSLDGKKAMDTAKVKEYYKNLIFIVLFADILSLGSTNTGSFALGQLKNTLTGTYAESILKNISSTLDNELIKQTYELNGWNVSRMGKLDYEGVDSDDLETLSKAIQRYGATGFLPKTHDVINRVLDSVGVDRISESEDLDEILPEKTTKSGEGLKEGLPSGTGDAVSDDNTSDLNSENAA